MQAIYASKLYKASKRKDKIQAALADPINKELVMQLEEYLDEDSLPHTQSSNSGADTEVNDNSNSSESNNKSRSSNRPASRTFHGQPLPSGKSSIQDDNDDLDNDDELNDNNSDDQLDDQLNDNSLSDDTENEDIDSATDLHIDTMTLPADIKHLLNLSPDTDGVSRVSLKANEVWIYYNDNVNLNNIMTMVIEKLDSNKYMCGNLEFNRLARTDNAIVFECDIDSIPANDSELVDNTDDGIVTEGVIDEK
jgi:hypothetical protein